MGGSYRFVVRGRVQGVGFRAAAQGKALFLGLNGWIRNRDDGAVEGVVGSEDAQLVERFRDWLTHGPPGARVAHLDWQPAAEDPGEGFRIRD
ncbi:MAG TPA: acylphosphatase [Dehalococcoidia bacterium]|nr:acylphosphatase [Nevskia sp.]HZU77070.1 acylphosphatase [Dehalococcoidia bacterium]